MEHIVIDNFLEKKHFEDIERKIMGRYFPWFYYDTIVKESERGQIGNQFFNMHMLYDNDRPTFNTSFEIMDPLLSKLFERNDDYKLRTLVRVKINSYPNQGKLVEHTWHIDTDYTHKGCLLAFNTCNGYTKFKDGDKIDKVESVANRAILFDPSKFHTSTNTTNAPRRVNININYF